jgi:hypothetical protein
MSPDRHASNSNYLKGSIYCGQCGKRLAVSNPRNRGQLAGRCERSARAARPPAS